MSDLSDLKEQIFKDGRIHEVLEKLGCEHVKNTARYGAVITAQLPPEFNSKNKRAVQIRNNESLSSYIRNVGGFSGDVYALISYILFEARNEDEYTNTLYHAKQWIIDELNYPEFGEARNDNKKIKVNGWLKEIKKKRRRRDVVINHKPNEIYDEDILKQYKNKGHKLWVDEGISIKTQKEFEIMFDMNTHRIVVPIRNISGQLIGVKGRSTDVNDDPEVKYIYLYNMNKSIELYGLHKTLPYILEKREIILFEGFKSVFKCWQYGYKNCASFEGGDIDLAQAHLVKTLGIDIKIVLCFDKDKKEEDIKEQAKLFKNRLVYIVSDKNNILGEKDSPVDKGLEIWEKLYNNRKLI